MFSIELAFPTGRYHATPYGRNVNEGVAEWPPSPFRLARALVDVCRRRYPDWEDERLTRVLEVLIEPPHYHLPPNTSGHIRTYMSSNAKDPTQKQKIFDAFVVVSPGATVVLNFSASPDPVVLEDLNSLLEELNYLGRSESWVRARAFPGEDERTVNAVPGSGPSRIAQTTGKTEVACLRPQDEYEKLAVAPRSKAKGKPRLTWLEAICLSSADLLAEGWSQPPALTSISYAFPENDPEAIPGSRRIKTFGREYDLARYALYSTVPPRVTETVPVAERIRAHLMGIHRKIMGGDPKAVSPVFSGKGIRGEPAQGHLHAFYLLLDEDGDGLLDHLLVQSTQGFDPGELRALDSLRSVWQPNRKPDIYFSLMSLSSSQDSMHRDQCWVSATPFTTVRHHRRGRGEYQDWLAEEIARECLLRHFPKPAAIEWTTGCSKRNHWLRWMEFVRSRKGRRPLPGHGCRLTFPKPVPGPFALGSLAHFGLGLFVPEKQIE